MPHYWSRQIVGKVVDSVTCVRSHSSSDGTRDGNMPKPSVESIGSCVTARLTGGLRGGDGLRYDQARATSGLVPLEGVWLAAPCHAALLGRSGRFRRI